MRRSRKKSKDKIKGSKCKKYLNYKISINMHEFKHKKKLSNGKRFVSKEQAIAAAYSQLKKKYPHCINANIIKEH